MELKDVERVSDEIRALFRALEEEHHGSAWSAEEDALAFLTDAALVGRLVMDIEGRWPKNTDETLMEKIGECVWRLAVLAKREGLDFSLCVEEFLKNRLKELK